MITITIDNKNISVDANLTEEKKKEIENISRKYLTPRVREAGAAKNLPKTLYIVPHYLACSKCGFHGRGILFGPDNIEAEEMIKEDFVCLMCLHEDGYSVCKDCGGMHLPMGDEKCPENPWWERRKKSISERTLT